GATRRGELASALREAIATETEPDPSFASLPSPATLAIEARPRVKPRRVARLRAVRLARVAAALGALAVGAFLTDYAYALFAKPLGVGTTKQVATARPAVGVIVDAPSGAVRAAPASAPPILVRGDLVEVDLTGDAGRQEAVTDLSTDLTTSGLHGVTVTSLMGSA